MTDKPTIQYAIVTGAAFEGNDDVAAHLGVFPTRSEATVGRDRIEADDEDLVVAPCIEAGPGHVRMLRGTVDLTYVRTICVTVDFDEGKVTYVGSSDGAVLADMETLSDPEVRAAYSIAETKPWPSHR